MMNLVRPNRRIAGARWRTAFPVLSSLALAACYQTPEWADPYQWAHEASHYVNSAVHDMRTRKIAPDPTVTGDPLAPVEAPAMPQKMAPEPKQQMAARKATEPAKRKPAKEAPKPAPETAAATPENSAPQPKMPTPDPDPKPAPPTMAAAPPPTAATADPDAMPMADPRSVEQQSLPPTDDAPTGSEKSAPSKPFMKEEKAAEVTPPPAAPAKAKPSKPDYAIHLASYRKMKTVRKEWERLVKAHPEHLMGLRVRVSKVTLGSGRGTFLRLKAGPLPSRPFAKELCASLQKQGLYCAVMRFTGRSLG